jgi:hypothetical protein
MMTEIAEAAVPTATVPLPLPQYWNLQVDSDKVTYLKIQHTLSSSVCKHQRHHANDLNKEILNSLQTFIMRNDPDDWKRGLVCGICWVRGAIAINIRQLKILLARCKSSVNSMFLNIGYTTVPTDTQYTIALSEFFPGLKGNFGALRRWTIRILKNEPLPPRVALVCPEVAPLPITVIGGGHTPDGAGDRPHPDAVS